MQCTSHMHASEQRDAVIQLHSKQRICTCSAFAWMRASGRAGRSMCSLALHTPCVRCDEPWGRPLACSASYSWYRTCRLQAALRHVCRRKRGPRPAFPPSTPLASPRSNLLKRARSYSACYIYPKSVTEVRVTCTGHGTLARKVRDIRTHVFVRDSASCGIPDYDRTSERARKVRFERALPRMLASLRKKRLCWANRVLVCAGPLAI